MAFINSAALLSLGRRKGKDGKTRHEIQSLTMQQVNAALKLAGLRPSLRLAGLKPKDTDTKVLHPASRTQVRTYPRCLIH